MSFSFALMLCHHHEALKIISKFLPNKYLIASDFMKCLLFFKYNPFNPHISFVVFHIKIILLSLAIKLHNPITTSPRSGYTIVRNSNNQLY